MGGTVLLLVVLYGSRLFPAGTASIMGAVLTLLVVSLMFDVTRACVVAIICGISISAVLDPYFCFAIFVMIAFSGGGLYNRKKGTGELLMGKNKTCIYTILLPFFLLILASIPAAYAGSWTGRVVGVSDGDTLIVMRDQQSVKIRLAEIDCPEKVQPFGKAAKRFTSDLCFGKTVTVQAQSTDRYGRTIAHVFLPDGKNINTELVRAGLAWHYKQYSDDHSLADLELKARSAKVGLWVNGDPVAPWEWRRGGRQVHVTREPSVKATQSGFHGNVRSKKFHGPGCKQYNCKNCTDVFPSRQAAVEAGYRPCGSCKP